MKNILLIAVLAWASLSVFAQDLVLTQYGQQIQSINKNGLYETYFDVANAGNQPAPSSIAQVKLYTLDFSEFIVAAQISIPSMPDSTVYTSYVSFFIPQNIVAGNYHVVIEFDVENQVNETDESNAFYLMPNDITINNVVTAKSTLPYPVLLVHGFNSSNLTWNDYINAVLADQQLTYGGALHYCLNQDEDKDSNNPSTDIHKSNSPISLADIYTINFDVDNNGEKYPGILTDDESNEEAVTKQAIALKNAIGDILAVTGKDKVILMGHSMGGLAIRQYLQTPTNHQADGKHHVAKVITIGTPHLGSNDFDQVLFLAAFLYADIASNAARDFRGDGILGGEHSVFLDGGYEADQGLLYHSFDTDCNDEINYVVGLNQKPFPQDVEYACAYSDIGINDGDGVVSATSANLDNLTDADRLVMTDPVHFPLFELIHNEYSHTVIHKSSFYNTLLLDETPHLQHAIELQENRIHYGFSTENFEGGFDEDMYKIIVENNGELNLQLFNIPMSNMRIDLIGELGNVLASKDSEGREYAIINYNAPAGVYYVRVTGTSSNKYINHPYGLDYRLSPISNESISTNFTIKDLICEQSEVYFTNTSQGNNLTYKWIFEGGDIQTSTAINPTVYYEEAGAYQVTLIATSSTGASSSVTRYIDIEPFPILDFDFMINGNTVQFFNASQNTYYYEWQFGDGSSSSEENPTHTYAPGTYTVRFAAGNNCFYPFQTKTFTIEEPVAVADAPKATSLVLFPNPASDVLYIDTELAYDDIRVFDATGRLVLETSFVTALPIQHLPVGAYVLRLVGRDDVVEEMFVVH